jgi:hypothetical protein
MPFIEGIGVEIVGCTNFVQDGHVTRPFIGDAPKGSKLDRQLQNSAGTV